MEKTLLMRNLGDSSLKVVPLCLGGNVFGWTADEQASFKVLDAFVEGGGNFIDTADVYSRWVPGHKGGESETVLGKWLKRTGKRDQIVLATKVGKDMGPGGSGLSRKHIMRAVEESLKRLQTDYIDLYQSHDDDAEIDLAETLGTYDELLRQGKIRAIGASNYKSERLQLALEVSKQHGYPRYESLQPEYNLYDREGYEHDLETLCEREHLGVISYFSLAMGFLTGKYRPDQDLPTSARAQGVKQAYFNERGYRILAALDKVSAEYNATPAQVSLAWLIARPSITSPIASATSVEQLRDLMKALELKLDASAIKTLDEASAWR
ncbi:aldo/keto reductase [Ktedonospora formicarum]|uniref:Oxidoreductase n=1 Tax=Ktedonospora formicarum TaxID=2778364 RepID=A0A8J3I712_9CHLR|nr:aldo/keto reductase [Ktedonospora formicarum]GHO48278.1 oxidoreductase [Ktedonospora formicarum]